MSFRPGARGSCGPSCPSEWRKRGHRDSSDTLIRHSSRSLELKQQVTSETFKFQNYQTGLLTPVVEIAVVFIVKAVGVHLKVALIKTSHCEGAFAQMTCERFGGGRAGGFGLHACPVLPK